MSKDPWYMFPALLYMLFWFGLAAVNRNSDYVLYGILVAAAGGLVFAGVYQWRRRRR